MQNTDSVEMTAELGCAEIPIMKLIDFRRDRPPHIQLDAMMKSHWPFPENVRIKIFGQTVFLGKFSHDRYRGRKMVQITEVLI